jgi:hypothetical protein
MARSRPVRSSSRVTRNRGYVCDMGRWLVYNEMLDITRNDLNRSGIRVLVKGVGVVA